MRLTRRPKSVLDTNMDLDPRRREPNPSPRGEHGRLGHFGEPQDPGVKVTHPRFGPMRRGKLHMMNTGQQSHRVHSFTEGIGGKPAQACARA